MPRPSTIDTQTILQVARRLFLEGGRQTPTAAIAKAAGISEGTIYKRFPTKEALFLAALGIDRPAWVEDLPERAGRGELSATLQHIIRQNIDFLEEMLPRFRVLWSSTRGEGLSEPPAWGEVLDALVAFFRAEERHGRICCDPTVAARTLLGATANYVFFARQRNSAGVDHRLDRQGYAEEVTRLLLRGMLPTPATRAGSTDIRSCDAAERSDDTLAQDTP